MIGQIFIEVAREMAGPGGICRSTRWEVGGPVGRLP